MENEIYIGLVIADSDEYEPVLELVKEKNGIECPLHSFKSHIMSFSENGRTFKLRSVLCGIGKVNAATATAFLINDGVDLILNCGLSGGLNNVRRGDIVVASYLLEHDFDLTSIGYKVAEKPGQEYIYKPNPYLNEIIKSLSDSIKEGVMVTGDSFINSDKKREELINLFSATSCDMETAAVAFACVSAEIPFAIIRKISDDAGDNAEDSYRTMNELRESQLIDIIMKILPKIEKEKL